MRHTADGIPVLDFDEIGSTNSEAMRLGLGGAAAPLWVRADRQVSGRGRSGRQWTSEPGNLYASLLIRLKCPPAVVHQLSFVAAVATIAAIRSVAGTAPSLLRDLQLKWPNDVLVGGAKLVGILPESTIASGGEIVAVLGIGINLAQAPDGLGRATTKLAAHGVEVTPQAMLDALSAALSGTLGQWNAGGGFRLIRERWLRDAAPLGTPMIVHAGSAVASGSFQGLDADGALILRDHSGYDQRMTFGDVTVQSSSDSAQGT